LCLSNPMCLCLLCCTAGLISNAVQGHVRKLEDGISSVVLLIFYRHVAERFGIYEPAGCKLSHDPVSCLPVLLMGGSKVGVDGYCGRDGL
jgi:hypothetical protein